MTNRRILFGILIVVAVIGGALIAVGAAMFSGDGAAVTPSPMSTPSVEGSPTVGPAESPAAPTPVVPSPAASAKPTAAPTATPAAGKPAAIVFSQLKLDAQDDPNGQDRVITFHAQGAGPITVHVTALEPQGTMVMCMALDGGTPGCTTTSDGAQTFSLSEGGADVRITLRGKDIETPVAEVAVGFPATTPKVTIENARFDGTNYPQTNGIMATVTARAAGDLGLEATWGGHPLPYDIILMGEVSSGGTTLAGQGPSTGTQVSLPIAGEGRWTLVLENAAEGFGVTPLDATIAWP